MPMPILKLGERRARNGRPDRWRRLATIGTATAIALTAAACGSSSSGDADTNTDITLYGHEVTADQELADSLPEQIKSAGVLKNISYNDSPPDEFEEDGKQVGWNVDLGRAVAAKLGLEWKSEASGAFDTFIPSLQNGRYDTVFSQLFYTPERAAVVDMVTFIDSGTGFLSAKGSPLSIEEITDLCGHKLSFTTGTSFQTQIPAIDEECKAAGKPAVDVLTFPTNAAVLLAVKSGRTELWAQQYSGIVYTVENAGEDYEAQPLVYMPRPAGVAIARGSGLTEPVKAAIDSLIEDGTYQAIMDHWKIDKGLVTSATIYDGTE